jgi:glutathione S-transferase kappa 1
VRSSSLTIPVSPYSWFGFTSIVRFRPLLEEYGITVEIIPFFLGAARDSAGNKFAPTPKWKEAFAEQDSQLTGEMLGLKVVRPEEFPILSLFVSLLRYALSPSPPAKSRSRQYAWRRG